MRKSSANGQYDYNPSHYGFMADVPHEINSNLYWQSNIKVWGQYKET